MHKVVKIFKTKVFNKKAELTTKIPTVIAYRPDLLTK